jgi:hypothetical protein
MGRWCAANTWDWPPQPSTDTRAVQQVQHCATDRPHLHSADKGGAQADQMDAAAADTLLVNTSDLQFNKDVSTAPSSGAPLPPVNSPTSDQGGLLALVLHPEYACRKSATYVARQLCCILIQKTGPAACRIRASRTIGRLARRGAWQPTMLRFTTRVCLGLQWATTSRCHTPA